MTVSEKLRLVQGLHSHAEMFGFNWNDGSDWTWHDVACKIADEIDAENAKLRERIHELEMEGSDHFYRTAYAEDANRTLEAENAKLRELMARMAEALGIDCEWADPDWCKSPCVLEFGCWPEGDHMSIRCPAWTAMRELGWR